MNLSIVLTTLLRPSASVCEKSLRASLSTSSTLKTLPSRPIIGTTISDLDAVAHALWPLRAATGEADAAAALADLYAFCAQALTEPRTPRAPRPGKPPPPPTPAERCAAYGAPGALTSLNLRSTARAWRRTAAELGDTVSQLIGDESFARPGTAAARERQRAAEALLRNGDYQGLLENMGYLIPISVLSQGDAWRPVLCSLVPNCESESCRMQCPADYLATSLRRLAPREQRVRMGQQAALLQAIRSGRFDELWDPGTGP